MIPNKFARMALAVLAVAAISACGNKSSSPAVNNQGAHNDSTVTTANPALAHADGSGALALVSVTDEAGNALGDISGFPALSSGVELLKAADRVSFEADTIVLYQGDTKLAVLRWDGSVVESRATLPLESVSESAGSQGQEQSPSHLALRLTEVHGCEVAKEEPKQEQGQKGEDKGDVKGQEQKQEQKQEEKCVETRASAIVTFAMQIEQKQEQKGDDTKKEEPKQDDSKKDDTKEQPKQEAPKQEQKPEQKQEQGQKQK